MTPEATRSRDGGPSTWDDAACRRGDLEVWFDHDQELRNIAIAICQTCPVKVECLAYALEHRMDYGIWGGKTERERRTILNKVRRHGR